LRKIIIVSSAEDAVCNQMQTSKEIILTYTLREVEPFHIYPGCVNELERQKFEKEEEEEKEQEKKEKQKKEKEEKQEEIGRKVDFF